MSLENSSEIFSELMERYGSGVWQYIYSLVKDVHSTQDLTQEVFLSAFRHLNEFRGESSVKTWIFAIAHNKCRDYFRSAFIRKVIPTSHPEGPANQQSLEGALIRHQEYHEVLKELFILDRRYREVVILHVHEEMTFREIAQTLGLSESTVKTRYRRAIGKLRDRIREGERHGY